MYTATPAILSNMWLMHAPSTMRQTKKVIAKATSLRSAMVVSFQPSSCDVQTSRCQCTTWMTPLMRLQRTSGSAEPTTP